MAGANGVLIKSLLLVLEKSHYLVFFLRHSDKASNLAHKKMKRYVDNDIVQLKLFPFSLQDHAKTWFSRLPKNSIDSWNKSKDDFISKYFPPLRSYLLGTNIMNLRNLIMNMLQNLGRGWN